MRHKRAMLIPGISPKETIKIQRRRVNFFSFNMLN